MHPEEFLCRIWTCQRCGFRSPWWNGCGRFPFCTECERLERNHHQLADAVVTPQPTHNPRPSNLSAAVYSYRPQRR
jgi:hypothetical protein